MEDKQRNKQIKVFGFGLPVILGFLAWRHIANHQWDSLAVVLLMAAGAVLVIALFFRSALEFLFKYWMKGAQMISMIMTTVILTVLYYGLFTPAAYFLRIRGKDFMKQKIDSIAGTYWNIRDVNLNNYKKQF